jgi:hypothetical protein
MQVQVSTDNHVEGRVALEATAETMVRSTLGRFADRITRVEVHLGDENGAKSRGEDKRCLLEARPRGRQPVTVTHVAGNLETAIQAACEKMRRLLDSEFGRLDDHKGRPSFAGDQSS